MPLKPLKKGHAVKTSGLTRWIRQEFRATEGIDQSARKHPGFLQSWAAFENISRKRKVLFLRARHRKQQ